MVKAGLGEVIFDRIISSTEKINYYKNSRGSIVSEILPLVSVITPAYNAAAYIAETIESVLAQTYSNWEMIIVNDCSTDNTAAVAASYVQRDARISFYTLEKNSGASAARNYAISKAKGRYIAFLDADDLWKRDKLQRQTEFMLRHNYAFTFTSYEIFHEGSSKRKVFRAVPRITYKQYLKNTIIGNLTVMMDCSQIKNITVQEGFLEDVLTWMYYLKQGYTAYGLKENLAEYRVYHTSVSGNKVRNAKRYFTCLREKQGLSLPYALYCEAGYLLNAIIKRIF